jgi:hypothetical protein
MMECVRSTSQHMFFLEKFEKESKGLFVRFAICTALFFSSFFFLFALQVLFGTG